MAINKKLIHFDTYSDFSSHKLSANAANSQYTQGVGGSVTTGSPDILYQSICWIKDTQQMWYRGQLYYCNEVDLSDYLTSEEIAELYATKDYVEEAVANVGSSGKIPVIDHGTSDTTFELTAGVVHKWGQVDSLTLTMPQEEEGSVSAYKIIFIVKSNDFSLSLPSNVRWSLSQTPSFSALEQYELSIEGDRALMASYSTDEDAFLDYIESTGNDYILTDYVITSKDYGFMLDWMPTATGSGTTCPVGTRATGGLANYSLGVEWSGSGTTYWSSVSKGANLSGVGTRVQYSVTNTQNTATNNHPVALFACNHYGTIKEQSSSRIYSFVIYGANGAINASFKPYLRASDRAMGFYEEISGKFYPSANRNLVGGML